MPSLKNLRKAKGGGKPSLATLGKPKANGKPSLAVLGKRKKIATPPPKMVKEDINNGGVWFHNAVVEGEMAIDKDGIGRYWGYVDVTNGDKTYTFHNKHGSWLADMGEGRMGEPAYVARLLGTNMSQVAMFYSLRDRFDAQLRKEKYKSSAQRRAALEEQRKREAAAKRKPAAKKAATKTTTKKAISLAGLGKK